MTFPAAVRCGKSAYSWKTKPTARRCGGSYTPDCETVHVLAPARTSARAGLDKPAIARRMVVLPLPDGPKIASTSPGSHENATSSAIGADCERVTDRRSATSHAARERRGQRERRYGNDEQRRRHHARRPIVKGLHAIV